MKKVSLKWIASFIVAVLFINIVGGIGAVSANTVISVFYNGKRIIFDVDPVFENETYFVEAKKVFLSAGMTFSYDENTKIISSTSKNAVKNISLVLGSESATINNNKIKLDSPSKKINNSIFIPINDVALLIGEKIYYDLEVDRIYIGRHDFSTQDMLRPLEWGRTLQEIKKVEKHKFISERKNKTGGKDLEYRLTLGETNITTAVVYSTDKSNKLNSIFYMTNKSSDLMDLYPLYMELTSFLNNVYTSEYKISNSDLNWVNGVAEFTYDKLYGDNYSSKVSMALLQKDLKLITFYKYKGTGIIVTLSNIGTSTNPLYNVNILYTNH